MCEAKRAKLQAQAKVKALESGMIL